MKRMLIDATSQSEIRLAITNEQKLENYEFEPRPTRYTKGNIYLAKVIRVEPSLQAAFVEYDDNTQGFLPFSEIHPDYFRIPVEDYEALMAEQREERRLAAEDADSESETSVEEASEENDEAKVVKNTDPELDDEGERPLVFTPKIAKRYKIQEVIKHGQLMLVQVTKEERGKKRAALSTYIALAGCYCVLIPNALFNGGVSRKIESAKERKRLKKVLAGIETPEGMALILRTAAEGKTKASLNRELKYLLKFWDELREKTMNSVAPLLIHEEGDLINRSLRDIFSKQIEEVTIAGKEAFKQAKDFTKALNPKLSRSLKEFIPEGQETLFESFGLETELQSLVLPEVPMVSGGALVIEQTEALVSIDVNSGRAISERNIEETALKTNLEAAEEIARQLRLRNLAGLIVIDFIDMERRGNQQKVERLLKNALKNDKARLHIGRISGFGLLEMSRQRLGPSIQEKTTDICRHCQGLGRVLHQDGVVLTLLRALNQRMTEIQTLNRDNPPQKITVHCLAAIAQLVLNEHSEAVRLLEEQYNMKIVFEIVAELRDIHGWSLDGVRGKPREKNNRRKGAGRKGAKEKASREQNPKKSAPPPAENNAEANPETNPEPEEGGRKKRRRKSRKPGDTPKPEGMEEIAETPAETTEAPVQELPASPEAETDTPKPKRKPRKNKKKQPDPADTATAAITTTEPVAQETVAPQAVTDTPTVRGKPQPDATAEITPKRKGWWNQSTE